MLASHETYFVTGTDTGVGKTFVSLQLLRFFEKQGLSTMALKPIASGCEETADGLVNEDALALQAAASIKLAYHQINPFTFLPPIAPHIAAKHVDTKLTVATLTKTLTPILQTPADIKLIEGAGGWLLPLNETETLADYIETLNIKIILVVKMQLGCLNHALLTAKNIQDRGLTLAGWVANIIDEPMPYLKDNIEILSEHFKMAPISFEIF